MINRLEVIKGLRCCIPPRDKEERDEARECRHEQCPYEIYEQGDFGCIWELMTDALSFLELQDEIENEAQIAMSLNCELNKKLKEQEPIKPKSKVRHGENGQIQHWCGNCIAMLHGKPKYCSNCGRQVKWE